MNAINFSSLCILLLSAGCIKAQPDQLGSNSTNFIQERINDNLYVLKAPDYNTNVGVFIGSDAVLLIDPMTGNSQQEILLNEIKRLSDKSIKYVLNTHNHIDHSGANSFFSKLGATIITHENSKYTSAVNDVTFSDSYIIEMGNETIEMFHIAAHTFDDALIYLKESNALFTGDTYMTKTFPHFYYGGGSKGHLKILEKALSLGDAYTSIIPAHGKLVSDKKQLQAYRDNSIKWINRIEQLYKQGKTSGEIVEDEQIKQLARIFSGSEKVWQQTIDKTISVDLIPSIDVSYDLLKGYAGDYSFEDQQVCSIIFEEDILRLGKEGAYLYELTPVSETRFHVKGQFPHRYITFTNNGFEFFDGKKTLKAIKD
ncbi:MBL fold metallo-hydrolase [Ekhidna sp.]|uniref:MBL fold metallo-hydrolase n=1 Tax=Ekhidna sp. TaxID=2608089 RepID=UPI003516E050